MEILQFSRMTNVGKTVDLSTLTPFGLSYPYWTSPCDSSFCRIFMVKLLCWKVNPHGSLVRGKGGKKKN